MSIRAARSTCFLCCSSFCSRHLKLPVPRLCRGIGTGVSFLEVSSPRALPKWSWPDNPPCSDFSESLQATQENYKVAFPKQWLCDLSLLVASDPFPKGAVVVPKGTHLVVQSWFSRVGMGPSPGLPDEKGTLSFGKCPRFGQADQAPPRHPIAMFSLGWAWVGAPGFLKPAPSASASLPPCTPERGRSECCRSPHTQPGHASDPHPDQPLHCQLPGHCGCLWCGPLPRSQPW